MTTADFHKTRACLIILIQIRSRKLEERFTYQHSVTDSNNSLTDGRTDVCGLSVRLRFTSKITKKSPTYIHTYICIYQRLAAGYGKWPQPVLDTCSMHLVTPVPRRAHSCQCTVQLTFCSAASVTLLLCEQSAVRYTLSAHNCTTHYRTAVAVRSLLPFIQSLSDGST
jgi:hypothetical protein